MIPLVGGSGLPRIATQMQNGALDLEPLLRGVLRIAFAEIHSPNWYMQLQSATRGKLESCRRRAERARGTRLEPDPWRAAGLVEIRDVLTELYSGGLEALLRPVWESPTAMRIDLERLIQVRHDQAHPGVVPLSLARRDEAAAMVRRIRLGLEAVRRAISRDAGDEWWPYLERIESPNIPEFSWSRAGGGGALRPRLFEGDEIEFHVSAVNPAGPQEELLYIVDVRESSMAGPPHGAWQSDPVLNCRADVSGRDVTFMFGLKTTSGGHQASGLDDWRVLMAKVIPRGAE